MKVNYKIVTLVPLFGLMMNSCNPWQKHTNVVKAIEYNTRVLIEDVKTGEERLVECVDCASNTIRLRRDLPYFHVGDTVEFSSSYAYKDFHVFEMQYCDMKYNKDSIQARKEREKIAQIKKHQQFKQR